MKTSDVLQRALPEMMLAEVLMKIADNDQNYDVRNSLIVHAMSLALQCGFEVGVSVDLYTADWPVIYIELPTGQVSWHVPSHSKPWDGHTGDEKVCRIVRYADAVLRGL
ncbi:MAG: hypothetical protein ABSE06_01445 [Anaerolineaceae bacterium]|jgi:hypothetical protein